MPALPGEKLLCTLFADIHYCFNAPGSKPLHDRFDKGSYVYLYHNATQRRARLEVANSAGSPEQDAFNGNLDSVGMQNLTKHPNLFSITVEANAHSRPVDQSQWCLPAFDMKNEERHLYRIHSLDLYFWTVADVSKFRDALRRVLPAQQLDFIEPPPPAPAHVEHDASMSPVVEQLERVAVADPPSFRAPSASTASSHPQPASVHARDSPHAATPSSVYSPSTPAAPPSFAPYNPAAPSAPEPIAHREKTPPPPDAGDGTGLASSSAVNDQSVQYANAPSMAHHLSYQYTPQQASFTAPPQRSSSIQSLPPPPPPLSANGTHGSGMQSPSFAPPPFPPMSPPASQHNSQAGQGYPQHQGASLQSPGYPFPSPGFPTTPGSPPAYYQHTPMQSPGFPPPPPTASSGPIPPVGGYSNYTYSHSQQQQQQQAVQGDLYGLHSQVYRPTEAEAQGHKQKPVQPAKPGSFEDRIGKVEKGVGRFLRKLDKTI